jgi:hypothetical protein
VIKQALNLLFKQSEWAREIRDYVKVIFDLRGIPWVKPVGADIMHNGTLVVVFPDGEQWAFTLKAEKL